jgi:hypothetical protein
MSARGNVEAMFASIENLREGVTQLLREIEMLKAENDALKGHVMGLQEQVEQAKHYIESFAAVSATEDYRGGRMERILPHDRAAEESAHGKKKKGGI